MFSGSIQWSQLIAISLTVTVTLTLPRNHRISRCRPSQHMRQPTMTHTRSHSICSKHTPQQQPSRCLPICIRLNSSVLQRPTTARHRPRNRNTLKRHRRIGSIINLNHQRTRKRRANSARLTITRDNRRPPRHTTVKSHAHPIRYQRRNLRINCLIAQLPIPGDLDRSAGTIQPSVCNQRSQLRYPLIRPQVCPPESRPILHRRNIRNRITPRIERLQARQIAQRRNIRNLTPPKIQICQLCQTRKRRHIRQVQIALESHPRQLRQPRQRRKIGDVVMRETQRCQIPRITQTTKIRNLLLSRPQPPSTNTKPRQRKHLRLRDNCISRTLTTKRPIDTRTKQRIRNRNIRNRRRVCNPPHTIVFEYVNIPRRMVVKRVILQV